MQVSCFRIEYEIIPSMNSWVAFIAAFSHEEAYRHLQRVVGKPMKITASGMVNRLDDVSMEVRQNIINTYLSAGKAGVGKKKGAPESDEETETEGVEEATDAPEAKKKIKIGKK